MKRLTFVLVPKYSDYVILADDNGRYLLFLCTDGARAINPNINTKKSVRFTVAYKNPKKKGFRAAKFYKENGYPMVKIGEKTFESFYYTIEKEVNRLCENKQNLWLKIENI